MTKKIILLTLGLCSLYSMTYGMQPNQSPEQGFRQYTPLSQQKNLRKSSTTDREIDPIIEHAQVLKALQKAITTLSGTIEGIGSQIALIYNKTKECDSRLKILESFFISQNKQISEDSFDESDKTIDYQNKQVFKKTFDESDKIFSQIHENNIRLKQMKNDNQKLNKKEKTKFKKIKKQNTQLHQRNIRSHQENTISSNDDSSE